MFLISHYQIERRNLAIDLLRGFGVMMVVCGHFTFGALPEGLHVAWPVQYDHFVLLMSNTYYAVTMFFAISGFIITQKLLHDSGQSLANIHLGRFYVFRFSRIFPGLALFCLVYSFLYAIRQPGFYLDNVSLKRVLYYVFTLRFNHFFVDHQWAVGRWGVLWSLAVEEVFYLCFPLFCLTLRTTKAIFLGLFVMALVGPYLRHTGSFYTLFLNLTCFDQLALGCMTAMIVTHERFKRLPAFCHYGLCVLGLALVLYVWDVADLKNNYMLGPSFIALGTIMMLAGQEHFEKVRSLSELSFLRRWATTIALPMCFLGLVSYELYLFHLGFFVFVGAVFTLFLHTLNWPLNFYLIFLITFTITALMSAVIGLYLLEPVSIWLRQTGKRLLRMVERKPALVVESGVSHVN